ncbi:hypothetical protein BDFG_01012 [Blastomyces dermatitidis ATCC 26199]|nr:hypothetical protein BDFG_01012 [Blastomyces dermatitidis ATCC 26199]
MSSEEDDACSDVPIIFNNGSESGSDYSETDDSGDELQNILDGDQAYDNEVLYPPEHYHAEASQLDSKDTEEARGGKELLRLKLIKFHSVSLDRYCWFQRRDPAGCFHSLATAEEIVQYLKGLFSWRCDLRRGKNGRRTPGIRYKSSLETFWKCWHLVYKQETGNGLTQETIRQIEDVLSIIAEEKKLLLIHQPKTFLGKKELNTFLIPEIIYDPTLVLSPHVFLLSMLFRLKAFRSIFKDQPTINCPENLYSLGILKGLNQQDLKLKDELLDQFVFCQAVQEAHGVRIALKKWLTAASVRYRMKRAGEITGFEQVTKLYSDVTNELQNVMLQHSNINTFVQHYSVGIHVDAQAIVRGLTPQTKLMRFACSMSWSIDPQRPFKLTKEQSDSVNELDCIHVLQDKVNKRWKSRDQHCYEYEEAKQQFEQALIDTKDDIPCQKCSSEYNRSLNTNLKCQNRRCTYCKLRKHCKQAEVQHKHAGQAYQHTLWELQSEKQQQCNCMVQENLEQYKNNQPVIDSQRQLSGKMVDEEVIDVLQRSGYMTPQHLILIDTVLTRPAPTVEAEYRRQIAAINTVTAFCNVEEGAPSQRTICLLKKRVTPDVASSMHSKKQKHSLEDETAVALREAITSVQVDSPDQRPEICFLCVGNPNLQLAKRTKKYHDPGSLTRHFRRKHVDRLGSGFRGSKCNVCGVILENKMHLMNHAESKHGPVSRTPL